MVPAVMGMFKQQASFELQAGLRTSIGQGRQHHKSGVQAELCRPHEAGRQAGVLGRE
jgi:hypothetical protein